MGILPVFLKDTIDRTGSQGLTGKRGAEDQQNADRDRKSEFLRNQHRFSFE
jgi:hypothetical protein